MVGSGVVKTDLNQTQESTTADNFEQDVVPQQTTDEMAQRSATQQAELETNQTIADNASQSQDFTPQKSDLEMEAEIGARANIQEEVDKFVEKNL